MNNIYLCLIAITIFTTTHAQYSIEYTENGGNPGGLHNEDEFDGGASWTSIYDCSTISNGTNIYTTAQTIPFTFNFAGNPVTEFKASNTGYITFDVSHPFPESPFNVDVLPFPGLGNQVICAWGIYADAQSTSAKMEMKVFGSLGSQQLWIAFRSFYNPFGSDAFDFTYWAIVLEEGTDRIYVVRQWEIDFGGVWEEFPVSVGVQVSGSQYHQPSDNLIIISKVNTSNFSSDNDYWAFTPSGVGIEDNEDTQPYSVFPNPTTGKLHIDFNGFQSADLRNSNGIKIMHSANKDIDLSNVPSGFYILQINGENGSIHSKKIVIE